MGGRFVTLLGCGLLIFQVFCTATPVPDDQRGNNPQNSRHSDKKAFSIALTQIFPSSTKAVQLPTPVNENYWPKAAGPPPWNKATCTERPITDAAAPPELRWWSVDTPHAFGAAIEEWRKRRDSGNTGGLSFSEQISNFFHGPEGMNCEVTAVRNGCNGGVECDDVNHPGGYLILNSMAALNGVGQYVTRSICVPNSRGSDALQFLRRNSDSAR